MKYKYKVGMISLGCPKNQVDGEILLSKLSAAGFATVNTIEDSDLMIVNTCGFIDAAKTEAIETILEVAEYKKAGVISAIVVTGCLAERYKDEVIKELPEVDAVIGIGANNDIVKVCQKALCGVSTSFFPDKCYLPLNEKRMLSTPPHWAYLKIAEGCDNRCAFCAIPGIRGKFRSRPVEEVVAEANELAEKGVKEIILIAQDTTKYGRDLYGEYKLAPLLRELVKIDKIEWIRLYYCYPQRITDELIKTIAEEDKICNYIDIPLQHSDPEVLKNMHRIGTGKDYALLLKKMRSKIPQLAVRTTLMVGFPGETDAQFENLCNFTKEMNFDRMGCFAFSPEEDTPAYDMENQIDDKTKNHRQQLLMELQYGIAEKLNRQKTGNVYKVIVDSCVENECVGRSYADSPEIDAGIKFSSSRPLKIGEFVNVRIKDIDGYDLIGVMEE